MKTEHDKVARSETLGSICGTIKTVSYKSHIIGAEKMRAIKTSTLLMAADGDGVLPEHVLEMYRLPGGNYMVDRLQKNGVKKFMEWSVKQRMLLGIFIKLILTIVQKYCYSWLSDSFAVAQWNKF